MSPDKKYLSLEDVAELLGVNYQLIYRLVRTGELPALKLGRVYRVAESDLDKYLEKCRTSAEVFECAACGQSYNSQLSMVGSCEVCGAPVCIDCWTRQGIRRCREHAQGGAKKG